MKADAASPDKVKTNTSYTYRGGGKNYGTDFSLTFYSLPVTLGIVSFNNKKFYMVITLQVGVLYGSQKKQGIMPDTTLTDCFL